MTRTCKYCEGRGEFGLLITPQPKRATRCWECRGVGTFEVSQQTLAAREQFSAVADAADALMAKLFPNLDPWIDCAKDKWVAIAAALASR